VQGTYYRPEDEGKWGPRISDLLSGTLHSHVMNFKADIDLVDTKNTFVKTEIVVENITQPWFPERGEFEMMRYNVSELQTEDEGLLNVPGNGQAMYQIVNKDQKNKWGEARGYRVLPGLSPVHLPSMNSPFFLKSGQFAKQQFAVSQQHDYEQQSSATLNQNVPSAPLIEFWKYFNSESLVQEDLVLWFNLGMQHYTRAEDIPNTLMSEAHSSIMFAPQNWGDAELTTDLQNAIIYNYKKGVELVKPETNGVEPQTCFVTGPEDGLLGIFEGVGITNAHTKDA
jgi:primary-amine oxidase